MDMAAGLCESGKNLNGGHPFRLTAEHSKWEDRRLTVARKSSREKARGRFFPVTRPQLMTFHLLIWMTATALLVVAKRSGYSRAFRLLPQSVEGDWAQFAVGLAVIFTILDDAILGIGICGFVIGILLRFQGKPFFQHPGHWVLAAAGAVGILGLAIALLKSLGMHFETYLPFGRDPRIESHVSTMIIALTQLVIYRLAIHNCDSGGTWDMVFLALSLQNLLKVLGSIYLVFTMPSWRVNVFWWVPWRLSSTFLYDASVLVDFVPYCVVPLIAVSLIIALMNDRHYTGRDWAHWTGVLVAIWLTLLGLLGIVPKLFFLISWFT